jgi:hypothetical protein
LVDVDATDYLGHREILAGDLNGDLLISEKDLSAMFPKTDRSYGFPLYDWKYDFDGDGMIDNVDIQCIRTNLGSQRTIYQETKDWLGY